MSSASMPVLSAAARDRNAGRDELSLEQHAQIAKLSVLEVSKRATTGAFTYAIYWIIAAQGGGFFERHRTFVLCHFAALFALGTARRWMHPRLAAWLERDFSTTYRWFSALVVLHGFYWGMLAAICMNWSQTEVIRVYIAPVTAAFVIGGTLVMATDAFLAAAFPLAMSAPIVAGFLLNFSASNLVWAVACIGMALYSWAMGRIFSRDFKAAQRARFLLENRARALEAASLTDALTRIPNRLFLNDRLAQTWAEARRVQQPVAVALIDLDHFKAINDGHGHLVGDRCLQEVATALRAELQRPSDVVARFGGEEFMVLMPNTDAAGALAVAHRLRERVEAISIPHGGGRVPVTCSIGVSATIPTSADGMHLLVQAADHALYRAKDAGRNCVVCADPSAQP